MALEVAADLCMEFEGFRSAPYLCPAGVPTIGYGATFYEDGRRVTMADEPITQDRAVTLLLWHLQTQFAPGVIRLCPGLIAYGVRFDAILDFAFNLGVGRLQTSTLRRRINALDWEGAQVELRKWVFGGGRKLPGLVRRREAECKLMEAA